MPDWKGKTLADSPTDTETVRAAASTGDRDRYVAALFAPNSARDDLFAIAALGAELATIPDKVREPMLGEIRLQWWREQLARPLTDGPSGHPIVDRMRDAITRRRLPEGLLLGLIDARAFELHDAPFPDEAALKTHHAKIDGGLFALAARCLSEQGAEQQAIIAGIAFGHARALHRLPRDLAKGRVLLPKTLIERHGVDPHDLLQGRATPEVLALHAALRAIATAALRQAAGGLANLPRELFPAFLPLAVAPLYIRLASAEPRDPLRSVREVGSLSRLRRLAVSSWSGRISMNEVF